MTKEEAIEEIRYYCQDSDKIIEALEQPCEDAISRKDMYFKLTNGAYSNETIEQFIDRLVKELKALPPVTQKPKYEDIAKAFQLGLAFGFGEKYDKMDEVIDKVKRSSEGE